jgi:hypothetical protein
MCTSVSGEMGLHDSFSECANSPVLYRSFLFSLVRRCAHDAQGIALSSFPHHVPDGVVQLGERLAENGKVDGSSASIVKTTTFVFGTASERAA